MLALSHNESGALGELDLLWLELTGKCNLNCVHCYAESSPVLPLLQVMRLGDWITVLEEAFDLGCRKVQFIGGEPTIHPDLPELIERSSVLGYECIEVFTNGMAFSDQLRNTFRSFRVQLSFSVYSHLPEIHDAVTLGKGSFLKTMEAVRWAVRERLDVSIGIIEMAENASTISEAKRFFARAGVRDVSVDRVRGIGRGALITMRTGNGKEGVDELCGLCGTGRLCVTATGEVLPCVFARKWPVGTARDGIKTILAGQGLLSFRSMVKAENCS